MSFRHDDDAPLPACAMCGGSACRVNDLTERADKAKNSNEREQLLNALRKARLGCFARMAAQLEAS